MVKNLKLKEKIFVSYDYKEWKEALFAGYSGEEIKAETEEGEGVFRFAVKTLHCTWDDMCEYADESGFGDAELEAKDKARSEVSWLAEEMGFMSPELSDNSPEEVIEDICDRMSVEFAPDGTITGVRIPERVLRLNNRYRLSGMVVKKLAGKPGIGIDTVEMKYAKGSVRVAFMDCRCRFSADKNSYTELVFTVPDTDSFPEMEELIPDDIDTVQDIPEVVTHFTKDEDEAEDEMTITKITFVFTDDKGRKVLKTIEETFTPRIVWEN